MKLLVDLAVVFTLLCAAASATVLCAHYLAKGLLEQLAPERRAKVRALLLAAPVVAGFLGVGVALVPSLLHLVGLASDHCLASVSHAHAHLCFVHRPQGVSTVLSGVVAALGLVLVARIAAVLINSARAHRAFQVVIASSRVTQLPSGAMEFDSEFPVCLTVGILRPRIFISSGAIAALGPECVNAALAHELGHLRRHETRMRLLVSIGSAFHLPVFTESLLRQWHQDSEFICDRYAAKLSGSAAVVADALVRFRRAQRSPLAPALSVGACLCAQGSQLRTRVTNLLALDVARLNEPSSEGGLAYVTGFGLLTLGLLLQAPQLHHALETLVATLASASR